MSDINNGKGWTFDTVSEAYDKMRPGYPAALYDKLFEYRPIGENSEVLEIGIGAGQATLPVLKTGCRLTAVEYGAALSGICREKFADFKDFSVMTGKFEETELKDNTYDLIYSAAAFHWIPEETGYRKVFRLLKDGGAFARFACHPDRITENPALSEEIDDLYAEYYYSYYRKPPEKLKLYTEEQAAERAAIAEKYGFSETAYHLFYRKRKFTGEEYVALLGTYSDHITIEKTVREAFFKAMQEKIDRRGGLTLHDTIDLELARKI